MEPLCYVSKPTRIANDGLVFRRRLAKPAHVINQIQNKLVENSISPSLIPKSIAYVWYKVRGLVIIITMLNCKFYLSRFLMLRILFFLLSYGIQKYKEKVYH